MSEPELDPLDFGNGPPEIDFGHGVRGRFYVGKSEVRIGLLYSHPMPNPPVPGRRCMGSIMFDTPEARADVPEHFARGSAVWQLNSLEPLDVSPSLLCTTCQHHGFIRNGQWIPA